MKTTINIYLDKQDRNKIDKLKVKYQLSLTTIVDILVITTIKTCNRARDSKLLEKLMNEYLYKRGKKTSIKMPKIMANKSLLEKQEHKSRLATNVLKIYLERDIKNYINDPKEIETYWNECNEKMTKTKDDFWNYNQHLRWQRRMLRENKDYFRKALEQA